MKYSYIFIYIPVMGVRAIKGMFGSDSSTSSKFGPEVEMPYGLHFCRAPDGAAILVYHL